VFPLKIKGEMTWLLPPLLVREGWGRIGFLDDFHKIYTPSHSILRGGNKPCGFLPEEEGVSMCFPPLGGGKKGGFLFKKKSDKQRNFSFFGVR
jgi:hypothetical protein